MSESIAPAGPAVVERDDQPYVAIRQTVTMQTISQIADRIPDVLTWLAQRGTSATAAPFLRYHVVDMQDRLDVEAGVPVPGPIAHAGNHDVAAGVLPGGS